MMTVENELLKSARADHAFVTKSVNKVPRERWVIEQWLAAQARPDAVIVFGDDPPDAIVDGVGVEVVEAMQPNRRRGDEYRGRVATARLGMALHRRLPSLREVQDNGHAWILGAVTRKCAKHYDSAASSTWTLLVYANFSWAERIRWDLFESAMRSIDAPFHAVEVVFASGTGHAARVSGLP
jgi:hypothetical protein